MKGRHKQQDKTRCVWVMGGGKDFQGVCSSILYWTKKKGGGVHLFCPIQSTIFLYGIVNWTNLIITQLTCCYCILPLITTFNSKSITVVAHYWSLSVNISQNAHMMSMIALCTHNWLTRGTLMVDGILTLINF